MPGNEQDGGHVLTEAESLAADLRYERATSRARFAALQANAVAHAAEIRQLRAELARAIAGLADLAESYRALCAQYCPDPLDAEDRAAINAEAEAEVAGEQRAAQEEMEWWEQFH